MRIIEEMIVTMINTSFYGQVNERLLLLESSFCGWRDIYLTLPDLQKTFFNLAMTQKVPKIIDNLNEIMEVISKNFENENKVLLDSWQQELNHHKNDSIVKINETLTKINTKYAEKFNKSVQDYFSNIKTEVDKCIDEICLELEKCADQIKIFTQTKKKIVSDNIENIKINVELSANYQVMIMGWLGLCILDSVSVGAAVFTLRTAGAELLVAAASSTVGLIFFGASMVFLNRKVNEAKSDTNSKLNRAVEELKSMLKMYYAYPANVKQALKLHFSFL